MEPTTETATEQPLDPMAEIKAMTAIAEAFRGLDPGQIHRALEWANKHYLGHSPAAPRKSPAVTGEPTEEQTPDFADFPALLAAASPGSGIDRTVLASYYVQVVLGQGDFDSFSANKELKNAGHASGNITRDLDALMARSPQLIMQTRKHGTSKQARKLYRLTSAGIAAAKGMLTK